MSEDTRQFERRSNKPLKTVGAWLAVAVTVATLSGGMVKAYIATSIMLEDHQKKIERLEHNAEAMAAKLQEQRDLLLEIRGDIKVLNRTTRTRMENN